jgi:hypothetical protein
MQSSLVSYEGWNRFDELIIENPALPILCRSDILYC